MSNLINTFAISTSGMEAQARRLQHVSENIANVDTPGYRRKSIPFRDVVSGERGMTLVETGSVRLDRSELNKIHDPSHPLADDNGNFDGSNVELVLEIADARQAQRSYEANLKMFDQARQMSRNLLDILRNT